MDQAKEELLKKIYYDPSTGLSSAMALYNRVRAQKITFKEVKDWLKKQETTQIFQPTEKTKIIYPPIVGRQDGEYQSDLMFLTQYKTKNSGYHIILNFIELTSRKAYSYKLKKKTGDEIVDAFKKFINAAGDVKMITVDNGSEFISKKWKETAKANNIEMVYSDVGDKTKMGKVERFNKTLRTKIMKYCKAFKTLTWQDKLDDFVANYNSSIHSSTGYQPNQVTATIADAIRQKDNNRMNQALEFIKKFKAGDKVRIKKIKGTFQKGTDRWSSGIYTIESVERLSLTLKSPKGVIIEQVKPYNVRLVNEVEKAPEEPAIEKHSVKENTKMNKFKRAQVREGFDEVTDEGHVVIPERLQPADEKRIDTLAKKEEMAKEPEISEAEKKAERFKLNDAVQAPFKTKDGTEKMYRGVVTKVNPKTYSVEWEDGVTIKDMKHDEMEPFVEPKNEEPKNEEPIKVEEKKDEPIKENDRVKSEFKKSDGTKAWYQGTVQKVNPKTYWVLWDDGKRYLMKKNEVFKL